MMQLKEKTLKKYIQVRKVLFSFNLISVALVSLILISLSFMIQLKSLGFYLDDLPELHALVVRGVNGIKTNFQYDDRPLAWWPFYVFYKINGTNPIAWHISNNLLRWLTGLGLWSLFIEIWKKRRREIFWTVLLFSVYPVFTQQSMALSYIPHWVCYLLWALSLLLMVYAIKNTHKGIKYCLFILSIFMSAINLFTYEYFIGVEFIRPVILWLIFGGEGNKSRLKHVFIVWFPYFVLTIFYIVWRIFLVPNYRGVDPVLFLQLVKSPLSTLLTLLKLIIGDTLYVLLTNWFSTMNVYQIDFTSRSYVFGFILGLLVFLGLLTFVVINKAKINTDESPNTFNPSALILGFIGVLLGCLPAWLTLNQIANANTFVFDRMAIPALWGASLFCVALLFYIFGNKYLRCEVVLAIVISLAVAKNFSVVNEFRWSTIWNNRLLSQIQWRIPYLKPNTLILSDSEYIKYIPPFAMSFQFNLLYPENNQSPYLDYYFLTINKYFSKNSSDIKNGIPVIQQHLYAKFQGITTDSIVISWDRTAVDCVWILSEKDRYNPLISENTRVALPASNYSRIVTTGTEYVPDSNIFGEENTNTWCYYFEKADLARQLADWESILEYYAEAKTFGFDASNGVELIPFIEAYAFTGQADIAEHLTRVAQSITPNMRNYTCDIWNHMAKEITDDKKFETYYGLINREDLCWEVK